MSYTPRPVNHERFGPDAHHTTLVRHEPSSPTGTGSDADLSLSAVSVLAGAVVAVIGWRVRRMSRSSRQAEA